MKKQIHWTMVSSGKYRDPQLSWTAAALTTLTWWVGRPALGADGAV
jgi:hypothetical protein